MPSQAPETVRIFILVTLDALRSDRLGLYGYARPTSPVLDRLAEESAVFDSAFSPGPNTPFAVPAMLSSTYPLDLLEGRKPWLVEGRPYLMRTLSRAGVRTGFVHCQPLLSENFGYADGVDLCYDLETPEGRLVRERSEKQARLGDLARAFEPALSRLPLWESLKPAGRRLYRALLRLIPRLYRYSGQRPFYATADRMTDRAISVLRKLRRGKGPAFLWIHYLEPHGPYFPPEECRRAVAADCDEATRRRVNRNYDDWVNRTDLDLQGIPVGAMSELYDANIRFVDREIGRLVDSLRESGMWEDCALVVSADHGEEFGEHGGLFHHNKLHRELLQVPLLLRGPGLEPRRVAAPVSTVDLPPTVAELLGVDFEPQWKGRSLLRFGRGAPASESAEGPVISECRHDGRPNVAATGPEFRLICAGDDGWQAYRREDTQEAHDVCEQMSRHEELRALRRVVEQRIAEVAEGGEDRPSVEDEGVKDRLRALGYLE